MDKTEHSSKTKHNSDIKIRDSENSFKIQQANKRNYDRPVICNNRKKQLKSKIRKKFIKEICARRQDIELI